MSNLNLTIFEIGSRVRLNSAPHIIRTIAGASDGQFILANANGEIVGAAWASDLRAA
jgi:hypothetical protein